MVKENFIVWLGNRLHDEKKKASIKMKNMTNPKLSKKTKVIWFVKFLILI